MDTAAVQRSVAAVRHWSFVTPTRCPHRQEPLLHERLWLYRGRELTEREALTEPEARRVGHDADGRITVVGPARLAPETWGAFDTGQAARDGYEGTGATTYPGGPMDVDVVSHEPTAVTVALGHTQTIARTTFDSDGRPTRTDYEGDETGAEIYSYDERGSLVAVDEASGMSWATDAGQRHTGDGHLTVEHDEQGVRRVVDEDADVVWERHAEPWPELLGRGARTIATAVIEAVRAACARLAASPGTEVFSLTLIYVNQGSLAPLLAFGLEDDRRAWLAEEQDRWQLALNLWYPADEPTGLTALHPVDVDADLDQLLLREGSLNQPDDPYRAVLNAVAALLSRHDWSHTLTPTDDFVVYCAEHDEAISPKHESVRTANPPERLAAWDAKWPPGVTRGEDERDWNVRL
jgi:hypothetical protein